MTATCTAKFRSLLRGRSIVVAGAMLTALQMSVGAAQAQGLPLIRDAEIEALLQDYAQPVFRAAGIGGGRVTVRIVNNDAFNAFVVDGANVFVHTGTLMQANTPNEVIGVIAHESGHIAGGHMAALRARIAKDQTRALLTQVLGIGAMVAGGVAGGSSGQETMQGGQAIMQGGTNIIMKGLLAERRSQESAADQAGLKYLTATKQSGQGMLATFERFKQQEYLSEGLQDPFIRSHPLSTDRLARLSELVRSSPYANQKDPPSLQLRHDLMRAKLSGYLESPSTVANRYPPSDTSLPARYARAIALFFRGGGGALEASVRDINVMIRENPEYPYFYELKADLLMRSGRKKEAIPDLRQALALAPGSPLIQVELASALQDGNNAAGLKESVDLLRKALVTDQNGRAYRLLANAYYKQGKGPEADAMTAQAYFYEGDVKQAQNFAKRAQAQLRSGSPEWLKNDDIINYKPQT
ncbi:peptidase M48 [Hyphomicrobium methylovorum]|uniref:M48 family metalloprotease n=1 Tax=Hyphomicrobium methylovorum TaxID=84 RepID=UPI0015E7E482|nr:M48 family metalloprotease [Hyphomicrobium methylovorum]MBA2125377.1 peptidase M48 [Hyphomicrobium methylovorum]